MKRWMSVVLASLMLVAVIGCSTAPQEGNNTPDEQESLPESAPRTTAEESEPEESEPVEVAEEESVMEDPPEPTVSVPEAVPEETTEFAETTEVAVSENLDLAIGETAEVGGVQATLLEAFTTRGSDFDQDYYLEQSGTTFLIARFQFVNGGQDGVEIGGSFGGDFVAYTQDGYQPPYASLDRQIESSAPRGDEEFSYTEVRPGSDITGTMAWVVEEPDSIQIEWQDYFAEEVLARWQVGPVSALGEQDFGSSSFSAADEQY